MKSFKIMLIMFLAMFSASLFAQLALKLVPNQQKYMQYEPIYMLLRIRNDSGRPIVFGHNAKLQAKLYFEITDRQGRIIGGDNPEPIILSRGKVINPAQTGDIVLKFSHYFKLNNVGTYRIHAYISHPLIKEQFKSNDITLEVTRGVKIWSRTIGVPDGQTGVGGETITYDSSRTYSIRQLLDGHTSYYYCTLEDNQKMYQVFRMGPVMTGERPTCVIDTAGSLHILMEIATKIFKYYKVDISGQLLESNKYYKLSKTRPSLVKGNDGKIFVSGGEPAVPNVDFLVREKSFTSLDEE